MADNNFEDMLGFTVLLILYLGLMQHGAAITNCVDDPAFNCAHIAKAFDICADVDHAKAVCRKFCNLCGYTSDRPRDCLDVQNDNITYLNGDQITVKVGPKHTNTRVKCDMLIFGGGWTVLMNRESAGLSFVRNSTDYAVGFGNILGNFWIGLETMHGLTSDGRRYQLLVKMTTANDSIYYEIYDDFKVGPPPQFVLHLGQAQGTAGNSLGHHSGHGFTTFDVDRDTNKLANCATYLSGAWWFYNCYDSCLTCPYVTPGTKQCRSMSWNGISYCLALKTATMMVRPM